MYKCKKCPTTVMGKHTIPQIMKVGKLCDKCSHDSLKRKAPVKYKKS